MALGWKHHQAGALRQAEQAYRRVLEQDPHHVDALYLCGAACQVQGRLDEAMALYQQVLALQPHHADVLNNLGAALAARGQIAEAASYYRQAVSVKPDDAGAVNNLGIALTELGQLDEALSVIQRALELRPEQAEPHYNLGNALQKDGQLDKAVASYRQALLLEPEHLEAKNNLAAALTRQKKLDEAIFLLREALQSKPDYAEAHGNLGNALKDQGRLDEAVAAYQQAIRLKPDDDAMHVNLGQAFLHQQRLEEASACFHQALSLKPASAEAYCSLALLLDRLGKPEEAVRSCEQALRLKPDLPEAHCALGDALRELGRVEEAARSYEEAIRHKPDHAFAHFGRGLIRLLQGDFEHGWPEYEWRWQRPDVPPRDFSQPLWDGSPLNGRTILLHTEQGLGDTLHFVRYAPLVRQRGGAVVMEGQAAMYPLLTTCPGIDRLVTQGSPLPAFDTHAPLVSLPFLFGTTLDTIPAIVPYLSADPERKQRWQNELSRVQGLKMGIAWQGNPTHPSDRQRSIPLARFAALGELPGVQLCSLQKGPGTEQLAEVADRFPLIDLGSRFEDFADTAAALASLDLIVTIDSAVAHCAGALGLPVWVLLPFAPDWRWLLNREDSPWYPTMRLFRQPGPGRWDDVFERVTAALGELLPGRARIRSPKSSNPVVPLPREGKPSVSDSAAALALGLQHHRSGELSQAERLYRQVLQTDPQNADALKYLGAVYLGQNRYAEAAASFQQTLRLRPQLAEVHNDLGVALAKQGKPDEAIASLRQAVRLRPDYPEAHNNLGIVLGGRGQLAEAITHYQQALRGKPDYAEAHNNIGLALMQQGHRGEAITHYQQALRLRPGYTEAQENLRQAQRQQGSSSPPAAPARPPARSLTEEAVAANRQAIDLAMQGQLDEAVVSFERALRLNPDYPDAHNNLGNVFYFQKRYAEAVACYEQAIRMRPDFAEAYNNLGNSLSCLKRHQEAADNCRKALALQPDFAGAHNNLGVALKGLDQPEEAIISYRRALRLKPDFAEAHHNLGLALAEQDDLEAAANSYRQALRLKPDYAEAHWALGVVLGELGQQEEALRSLEQAIRYKPDYAEAHLGRGLTLLLLGRLAEGWPEYEWRRQCREMPHLPSTQPAWNGSPLNGRPILLVVEQGLGDTLQLIRYAPLVRQRGGRVTVWCPAEVKPLLATCPGVEQLVTDITDWPHTHAQLLSLPGIFGTTPATIPAAVPYLSADPALVESWRQELAGQPGLKVGIVWQGNPEHPRDRFRSLPLARFEALARVAGVRLISLQVGAGSEQLAELGDRFAVADLSSRLDRKSVMNTAALVTALDLVITVDTAMAHLAGALGRPVWVLLPFVSDWRWLQGREDSPWYPTMRLFRQTQRSDWDDVFERVAAALNELVAGREYTQGGLT